MTLCHPITITEALSQSSLSEEAPQQTRPSSSLIPAHQDMVSIPGSTPAASLPVVALLMVSGCSPAVDSHFATVDGRSAACYGLSTALSNHSPSFGGLPLLAAVGGPMVVSGELLAVADDPSLTTMPSVQQQKGRLAHFLLFPSCGSDVFSVSHCGNSVVR